MKYPCIVLLVMLLAACDTSSPEENEEPGNNILGVWQADSLIDPTFDVGRVTIEAVKGETISGKWAWRYRDWRSCERQVLELNFRTGTLSGSEVVIGNNTGTISTEKRRLDLNVNDRLVSFYKIADREADVPPLLPPLPDIQGTWTGTSSGHFKIYGTDGEPARTFSGSLNTKIKFDHSGCKVSGTMTVDEYLFHFDGAFTDRTVWGLAAWLTSDPRRWKPFYGRFSADGKTFEGKYQDTGSPHTLEMKAEFKLEKQ